MDGISDGELFLMLNGLSRHGTELAPDGNKWNETNPGLGLMYEWGDDIIKSMAGGTFKNSLNNNTAYAGGGIKKRFGKDFYADIGVLAGLMAGGYDKDVAPFLMPALTLGKKDLGALNLMYGPKTEYSPSTWMLNAQIPFGGP